MLTLKLVELLRKIVFLARLRNLLRFATRLVGTLILQNVVKLCTCRGAKS
jgi:hypothetical protein